MSAKVGYSGTTRRPATEYLEQESEEDDFVIYQPWPKPALPAKRKLQLPSIKPGTREQIRNVRATPHKRGWRTNEVRTQQRQYNDNLEEAGISLTQLGAADRPTRTHEKVVERCEDSLDDRLEEAYSQDSVF